MWPFRSLLLGILIFWGLPSQAKEYPFEVSAQIAVHTAGLPVEAYGGRFRYRAVELHLIKYQSDSWVGGWAVIAGHKWRFNVDSWLIPHLFAGMGLARGTTIGVPGVGFQIQVNRFAFRVDQHGYVFLNSRRFVAQPTFGVSVSF